MRWRLVGQARLGGGTMRADRASWGERRRRGRSGPRVEVLEGRELLSMTVVEYPLANKAGTVNTIAVGLDGEIWYSESLVSGGNVLGRMNPATGAVIAQYPVAPTSLAVTGLAAGPDNGIWFTETNAIGRLDPATGQVTSYPLQSPGDLPSSLTVGPDNNLWFTIDHTGKIGKITTAGVVTEFPLSSSLTAPGAIHSGPDGNLWFSETLGGLSGHGGAIGTITTAGQVTEFSGPVGPSGSAGLAAGSDGNLWVTDGSDNVIDRINPATGAITGQVAPPTAGSNPHDITAGPNQDLYFTEQGGNQIGAFNPSHPTAITEVSVPTPGAGPYQIVTGQDGAVWFSEFNNPAIGMLESSATGPGPSGPTVGGGGGGTPPTPPTILTAQDLFQAVPVGHRRKGRVKTRNPFVGFQLTLNEALDPTRAANVNNYSVLQTVQHRRKKFNQPVGFRVSYTPRTTVVDLVLAGQPKFSKGGELVVNAASPGGIADPAGDFLVGTTVFAILPKARGLTP